MTKLHENGTGSGALADTIIVFQGARREKSQSAAMTGAEVNARLLLLLGICTTTAATLLLAVHILHG